MSVTASGIEVAVAGAVAANAYMPPRSTGDLDLALRLADLGRADTALARAGWTFLGDLDLYEDLRGTAWRSRKGNELDLIGLPGAWGRAAIDAAQKNVINALPTLTLPFVVIMKLISSRAQDTADISRMLGAATDDDLRAVRQAVARHRSADLDDLDQIVAAGKLEFGSPIARTGGEHIVLCRVCRRPLTSPESRVAGVGPDCALKETLQGR